MAAPLLAAGWVEGGGSATVIPSGHLDDAVSDLRGGPVLRRTARGDFWCDTYRIGTAVKAHDIGPDRAELRARIAHLKLIREQEACSPTLRGRVAAPAKS